MVDTVLNAVFVSQAFDIQLSATDANKEVQATSEDSNLTETKILAKMLLEKDPDEINEVSATELIGEYRRKYRSVRILSRIDMVIILKQFRKAERLKG